MGVTYIKWVFNRNNELVLYQNHENRADWLVMPPRNLVRGEIAYNRNTGIPWCWDQGRFNDGHWLELATWDAQGNQRTRHAIWQHDRGSGPGKDGDRVRFSSGGWANTSGNHVAGGETVDGERGFEISWDANKPGNLRPLFPRPPRLENFRTLVADDESPKPDAELNPPSENERNALAAVPAGYSYLRIRPDFTVPETGRGEALIADFAVVSLPNNNDLFHFHVYPDGSQPYPGLPQDQIRVGLRKRTGSETRILAVWRQNPNGSFSHTGKGVSVGKEPYANPIRFLPLTRGETIALVKNEGGGSRQMAYDPTELFRAFGGKVIIINWWHH
jgi:hypothetical protein